MEKGCSATGTVALVAQSLVLILVLTHVMILCVASPADMKNTMVISPTCHANAFTATGLIYPKAWRAERLRLVGWEACTADRTDGDSDDADVDGGSNGRLQLLQVQIGTRSPLTYSSPFVAPSSFCMLHAEPSEVRRW